MEMETPPRHCTTDPTVSVAEVGLQPCADMSTRSSAGKECTNDQLLPYHWNQRSTP